LSAGVFAVSALVAGATAPAYSQEVWLADLKVELKATENPGAGQIVHEITVTNKQDDTGRDIVVTHIPVIGMQLLAFSSQASTCAVRIYSSSAKVVQCSLPTLNVGASEKITVITRNTTSWPGRKVTTAQVMGGSPDADGSDNVASVDFP
jgi:hypothetical protein